MKTISSNGNRSRSCTGLQRWLTIVLLFTWATVIGLVSGLDFVLLNNQLTEEARALQSINVTATQNDAPGIDKNIEFLAEYKGNDLCNSFLCTQMGTRVLLKMNTKIQPCNDFNEFACGRYRDTTEVGLPPISNKWLVQLRNVLAEKIPPTEPKYRSLPNILYNACMNLTSIERLSTRYINRIAKSLGGWPVLNGKCWDCDNSWTWPDLVKKSRRLGYSANSLIYLSISVDSRHNTRRIINLDQCFLGLSREFLIKGFNESSVWAYYEYMVDIAVLFGADREEAKEELWDSLQFEIALARISWPDNTTVRYNTYYNLRSIKQLQKTYPYVQWLDYINAHLPEGLEVDENEVVNMAVPKYFNDLGRLLQRTKKRVIANYMMWHFHELSVVFLTEEFRDRFNEYNSFLAGRKVQRPRWKECVDVTLDSLPIAVGSLYMRRYFNEDAKASILEMINNTRSAFSQILDNVKWMDDKTKQEAKKKLESMKVRLGYPEEMLADDKLEEFYRKLEMDPNMYFESYLKLNAFTKDYLFGTLKTPVNKNDWFAFENLVTATAFYSPPENSLNFPVGVFQEPLFGIQRPMYMNYGILGSIIGHAIAHGFDSIGRQFDGDGNLMDWWQPDAEKAYSESSKCIIEQYEQYSNNQTELTPDGVNIQNEYIANIIGIKAAYLAYKQWVAKNGEEPQLPGLMYTARQMFWISAAQSWCAKYGSETQLISEDHLPSQFRVISAFSNIKSFSCDFQCRKDSPMNPTEKCEVW